MPIPIIEVTNFEQLNTLFEGCEKHTYPFTIEFDEKFGVSSLCEFDTEADLRNFITTFNIGRAVEQAMAEGRI